MNDRQLKKKAASEQREIGHAIVGRAKRYGKETGDYDARIYNGVNPDHPLGYAVNEADKRTSIDDNPEVVDYGLIVNNTITKKGSTR